MAGESPDKSEQRKSSGTAPEERDPRLSVLREPVASASSGSGSGTGGAGAVTDTATAVFRTPADAEPDSESDSEPDEERTDAGSDAKGAVVDTEGAESGSESVRDATERGTAPEGAEEGPGGGATASGSGLRAEGTSAAETAAGAAGAGGTGDTSEAARAGEAGEAGEVPEADEAAVPEARTEPEPEPEPEPASDAGPEPSAGPEPAVEPTDVRLRAVVAAWVSTGDEPAADAPEADDSDVSGDVSDSDASDETPDERPEPGQDSDAPHVPKTREEATGPEALASGGTASGGTASGHTPGERGIDHPTAVFKAPRPAPVDRPTTTLKLPPTAPKPAAPAAPTSKFVPLRSDDVRPAPAPAVGPTVTPDITRKPGYGAPGAPGTRGTPGSSGSAWNASPPVASGLTEAERTRQQPLPPKPPLDLLAELTNTPPPRQTPVRTVVRRVKIWTPLLLLVVIIFAIAQAVRPLPEPELVLSADPTYTFGGDLDMPWPAEGQGAAEVEGVGTIGAYGKEKSAPIASIAKVMTAYVILKEHPITGDETGERIEVDKKAGDEADRPDESTAPIKEGQKYTERQMLQLLMIPSGNNVARLLARWDATTEEAFVEKMNEAAKDLGMTKSTYTDPSGLESSTVSTPADQIKLAEAVMQNDVFRKIVNMPQADIPGISNTIYNNNNILLEPGVSGIKTGSSTPAGGNLLWAADTIIDGKNRRILGVVMGADTEGTLDSKLERARQNSLKLIQAAKKGVDSAAVVKKGQVVGYVDDGFGGQTPVVATKDLKAIGWGGLEVKLEIDGGDEPLGHVAKPGTVVGAVMVGSGTGKVSVPVALRSEMTEPTFVDKLTRIG